MSTILNKANQILQEKQTKIIPNNIKDQVQIFDILGDFVGSGNTGAYQVSSIEEMEALEGMEIGDYCIVEGVPEYVIPETATFTRFTGNPTDIMNGVYDDHMFILMNYANTNAYTLVNKVVGYGSYYADLYAMIGTPITKVNDSITLDIDATTKNYIVQFVKLNDVYAIKSLNNKYIKEGDGGQATHNLYATADINAVNFCLGSLTYNVSSQNYTPIFVNRDGTSRDYKYALLFRSSSKIGNGLYADTSNSDGTTYKTMYLYACRLETTTVDHLVYEYRQGSGWVDVTDNILVPQTNITPTTSSQTPRVPDGYRGFKNVTVNAVQTETKSTTPKTIQQIITPSANKYLTSVTVNATPLEEAQTVTPTDNIQTITPTGSNIGLASVIVNPVLTSNINITPSTNTQTFTPTGINMGFNTVTVSPVDNTIDSNITPENIKVGVNILGITGTLEGDPEELNNAQAIVTNILEGYGGE